MELVVAGALSFCLDLLLGDPGWIPHPVVWMGRAISGLEERLRRIFPKTTRGEWAAGRTVRKDGSSGRSPQRRRNAAGPAVGRGWKRSGMRAGETSLLAVGQGVWYH